MKIEQAGQNGQAASVQPAPGAPGLDGPALVALLDLAAARRDSLIAELRHIDRLLVENGRLKSETLPRRVR